MPRTGKNNERTEQAPQGNRKPNKVEPLHPQDQAIEKHYNDIAKFPSENPYPILRIHKDGTILYANKASEPFLKAKDTAVGLPAPSEWRLLTANALSSRQVTREETTLNERVFAFRVAPITENDYANFYGVDITEQKIAQEEREITIKLLSLINSRNQIHDLMKLVTAFLKDWSGCEAVGIRLRDGEDFPYFETSGFSKEFILAENKLCSVNGLGQPICDSNGRPYLECMCGNIISGRFDPSKPFFTRHGSFWTNCTTDLLASTTSADRMAKTRNRCNTAGYESVALVPLRAGKETFGLLQFNSKEKNRFRAEKISLLERLADNLAIGLAQRKAEQAMRENEDKFKTLAEESFDSIVIHDGGKILEVNKRFTDMWGYEPQEVIGMEFDKFISPESLKTVNEKIRQGHEKPYEVVAIRKDGTRFPLEIAGKSTTYKGKIARIATSRDITERRLAEEALRESEKRFRSLFENMVEGFAYCKILLDKNDRPTDFVYLDVNDAFEKLTGLKNVEGKKVTEVIPGIKDSNPELFEIYGRVALTARPEIFETYLPALEIWFSISVYSPQRNHFVAVFENITDRKRAQEALRKSEDRLKAALNAAELGIWDWDLISRRMTWAGYHERLFGLKDGEFDGRYETFAKMVHPDDIEDLDAAVKKSRQEKSEYSHEFRVVLPDGNIRWMLGKAQFHCDQDGRAVRMLGTVQDITEQKQADTALRTSEAKLSNAIKIAKLGYWEYDVVNDLFTFNDQFYSLFRATEEQVGGYTIPSGRYVELFVYPEDRKMVGMEIQKALETTDPNFSSQLEHRIIYADGEIGHIAVRYFIVKDNQGRTIKTYGANQDITERKRAEEQLQEERNLLRTLIDHIPDKIYVKDRDSRFIACNESTVASNGVKKEEELIGKTDFDLFEKALAQQFFDDEQELMRTGRPIINHEIPAPDGGVCCILVTKVPLRDRLGNIVGMVGINRDITEHKTAERLLRKSEERFKQVAECAGEWIWEVDAEGLYTYSSPNAEYLLGYKPEEIVGKKHFYDFFARDVKESLKKSALEAFARKESFTGFVNPVTHKNGTTVILETTGIPIMDDKGNLTGYRGADRDITDRKQAEEKLQNERNLLRTLIDNIPDKVYIKDKDCRFVVCNKTISEYWSDQIGGGLVGKTDFDLFEKTRAKKYFEEEQKVMRTGQTILNHEGYCSNKNGKTDYLLVTKTPLQDSQGNITGLLGIHRDITERKLAEERLEQERNLLRTLIDHIPDEVYVKDIDSRMVVCNKAVIEFWDIKNKSGFIGKTDFELFDKDKAQQYFDEEQEVMRTGNSIINLERQCIANKDKARWVLTTKVPLRDNHGNITGIVGINRNITERKITEQRLVEYQKKLKSLASELTLTEERERRRMAGELHDHVGQSLAMAKIKLDSLHAEISSQPFARTIEDISDSIEKAIQDTRSLTFDLSNPILYELGFEAAIAEWLLEHVRDKYGIETRFEDDGKPKPLDNDVRAILFRNVRELLINIIKHAQAKMVKVEVHRVDDLIEVTVEDNGVGYDPADLRPASPKKQKFGLFSIRENIQQLGGCFEIVSKPGTGCKARITAPLKGQIC